MKNTAVKAFSCQVLNYHVDGCLILVMPQSGTEEHWIKCLILNPLSSHLIFEQLGL